MATPKITLSTAVSVDASGVNETLTYEMTATRQITISSKVTTSNGTTIATWKQNLSYYTKGIITNYGYNETNIQQTTGTDKSSGGYARQISYPLNVFSYFIDTSDELYIYGVISRGQTIQIIGQPVFPTGLQSFLFAAERYPTYQASTLSTTQNCTAVYNDTVGYIDTTSGYTNANATQELSFSGNMVGAISDSNYAYPTETESTELYYHYVAATDSELVEDYESLLGKARTGAVSGSNVARSDGGRVVGRRSSVRKILGRGLN